MKITLLNTRCDAELRLKTTLNHTNIGHILNDLGVAQVQTYRSKRITKTQPDYFRHSMRLRQNCDQPAPASKQ